MDSELILGLRISVLGLSLTFLAMGLVILVMVLLLRFFPARGDTAQAEEQAGLVATEDASEQAMEEMAVALAVGICLLEQNGTLPNDGSVAGDAFPVANDSSAEFRDPSLGKLLEE